MSDVCELSDRLHRSILELHQEVDRLSVGPAFLNDALRAYAKVADAARLIAQVRDEFAAALAEVMPDKRVTVMGVGTFERHRKSSRKSWDKDQLLRDVLDTRRVDPSTGEVRDEAPIDKVLDVWTLGAPKVTALRERGLDPDDYCAVERGAMTLEVVANG